MESYRRRDACQVFPARRRSDALHLLRTERAPAPPLRRHRSAQARPRRHRLRRRPPRLRPPHRRARLGRAARSPAAPAGPGAEKGGGRQRCLTLFPGLDAAFLRIVDPHTAGDPDQDGVLWTNLSRPEIAQALKGRGFRVGVGVVAQLLKRHRLGRRKALKTLPMGHHADRGRQFRAIAAHREAFLRSGDPVVSMDTKRKEFLGLLFRQGKPYAPKAKKALDHDFPSAARGVVYPHGFYDIKRNLGHLNLGTSRDTSRFACESLAAWWEKRARAAYPEARRMLVLCDGGGRDASNRYVFKHHLERLACRLGLEVRVAHYPP